MTYDQAIQLLDGLSDLAVRETWAAIEDSHRKGTIDEVRANSGGGISYQEWMELVYSEVSTRERRREFWKRLRALENQRRKTNDDHRH